MKRSLLPITLVLAALLIPAAAHAASTGSLSVTVAGAPKKAKKAKRTVTVRAINVRTGTVTLSATSKRANPTVKLAPGAYVLAVRTIDFPGTASEGTSGIAVVKAGKRTKKKLRVKPLRKKKKKAKKSVAASGKTNIWAPESEYSGLRVVGVDPRLAIKGLKEYPNGLEFDSVLLNTVTQGCQGDSPKIRVVEIRRRGEIIDELEHFDDERFDKSTIQPGHLLKERELVKGSALVSDGKLTINLRLVDVATGETRAAAAVTGDGKTAQGVIDTIDAAGQMLLDSICGGKVDVTFTGSNAYQRDEGTAATDSQDAVRANYTWTTTYKGVNLAADGTLNFSTSTAITGNWHTDGRFGVEGPGSYHCEAPVKTYVEDFAMLNVKRTGPIVRFEIDPYLSAQGDFENTNCTGLPGPPYSSFTAFGHTPANQAVVEFSAGDLAAAGSLTFNVAPQATLAADCSDVVGSVHSPCSQSQVWSGSVTVTKAE